ncbi:MAG: hypothetical protein R3D00_17795 [Bacteroidia bacterium]
MNIRVFSSVVVLIVSLAACSVKTGHNHSSENTDSPVAKLMGEVMAVHDEVMPQMSKLYDLKKSLAEKTETLGDSAPDMEMRTKIEAAMQLLEKADESMMNWMRNFEDPGESDVEKATAYLEKEKERVLEVQQAMNEGIQAAELLLQ